MVVWVWLVKYVGGTKMTPVFLADCIPGLTCQDKWNRTGLEGNSWVQCWTCWVEVPLSCPCESLSRWLDICLEVWEELWVEDMPLGLSDNTRCQLKLDMYGISRGEDLEWESKPSGRSEPCKMLTLVKRQRRPRENQGSEQHRMSAEGWVIDNQELLESQVSGGLKVSTSLPWQREQFNRGREQNLGCGMGERGQLLQGVQLWVEHHWGCRWRGQNSWGRACFFFFFFKMAAILVKASWSLFSYSPDAVFPNRLDYLRAGVSILFLVAQVVRFCDVSYICRMNSLSFRELWGLRKQGPLFLSLFLFSNSTQ